MYNSFDTHCPLEETGASRGGSLSMISPDDNSPAQSRILLFSLTYFLHLVLQWCVLFSSRVPFRCDRAARLAMIFQTDQEYRGSEPAGMIVSRSTSTACQALADPVCIYSLLGDHPLRHTLFGLGPVHVRHPRSMSYFTR